MPKKKKRKMQIRKSRGAVEYLIIFLVVAFGVLISGFLNKSPLPAPNSQFTGTIQDNPGGTNNLQLRSPTFITATPAPTGAACNHDNGKPAEPNTGKPFDPADHCECPEYLVECKDHQCVRVFKSGMIPADEDCSKSPMKATFDQWCTIPSLTDGGTGIFCLGKPVIYLYPTKTTLVNVIVTTPGKIIVSDPLYPAGGWKNVEAHPDGTLFYQNKKYRELFYETASSTLKQPTAGLVFETAKLKTELLNFIKTLGLNRRDEQQEFLDWWIPKLENLNSPYIFVSVLEDAEKKRLDNVEIYPKPDTFIDFIVYYKPVSSPMNPNPLVLPPTPQRHGFTAVEWGGIIDYSKTR